MDILEYDNNNEYDNENYTETYKSLRSPFPTHYLGIGT